MAPLDPKNDPWRDEDYWPPEPLAPGACQRCHGSAYVPVHGDPERLVKPCTECEGEEKAA